MTGYKNMSNKKSCLWFHVIVITYFINSIKSICTLWFTSKKHKLYVTSHPILCVVPDFTPDKIYKKEAE